LTFQLVAYDDAEWQLNDDVIQPERIVRLIERASGIVLDNIDDDYPASWAIADTSPTEYEVPASVQEVTLMLVAKMNRDREDTAILDDTMVRMLQRWRTPTMSSSPDADE
jgi:hypothetical protein